MHLKMVVFYRRGEEYLNKFMARNRLIFVLTNFCISYLNSVCYFYLCKEIWGEKINKLGSSCGKPKIEYLSRYGWKQGLHYIQKIINIVIQIVLTCYDPTLSYSDFIFLHFNHYLFLLLSLSLLYSNFTLIILYLFYFF